MDLGARFIRRRDQSTTGINLGPLRRRDGETEVPKKLRVVVLVALMLLALGIISARLTELTIIDGAKNRLRADENRMTIRPIRAARGVILDRHGNVLTRNIPVKRLLDIPGDDSGPIPIEDIGRSYPYGASFAHVIGYVGEVSDMVGKTGLEKEYDGLLRGRDGAELIEVDANGKIVRIEGEELPIPGENIQTSLDLSLQLAMTKALGNSPRAGGAGRRGAAVAVDPEDGSVLGLVSSPSFDPNLFQKTQNTQSTGESDIPGGSEKSDLRLSDSLTSRSSGSPSFPSVLDILNDTVNLPLFNRAVSGAYPPGSIFKLVTATAGLVSGKVTDRTTITDTGELRVGSFRYGNWYFDQYGRTEGVLGIVRAIARSNDIFFYKVGEWVGPQLLSEWAKRFGLGAPTGIDIPAETAGLIPDPMWKERQIGERWFLGNTYHMAIGQGDVRVTPLQVAVMTSAVVTGKLCSPHIATGPVARYPSPTSSSVSRRTAGARPGSLLASPVCEEIRVSDQFRSLILEGMVGACSPGGTAFPFFEWNQGLTSKGSTSISSTLPYLPPVACKTGTAQHGGEKTKPHAWIVVAGPVTECPAKPDPALQDKVQNGKCKAENAKYEFNLKSPKRIVLVVMLEEAGEGSSEAGPVAKQILEEWFK